MKGKQIVQINFGGTNIKDPDIFKWNLQNVGYSKPMTYTIDELEDYGIYYRVDAGGKVLTDGQFMYSNGALVSLSNDPHIAKDFRCQAKDARKEGWYFAKVVSAMPDVLQVENMQIIETIKAAGAVDDQLLQMEKLNNTGDRENTTMVNKILKTKYDVEIQQEGVHGRNDS